MRSDEEIAHEFIKVTRLLSCDNVFRIPVRDRILIIKWDGCAVTREGLILIEVEKGIIERTHIYIHLLLFSLVLKKAGFKIAKIIWLTNKANESILKGIVAEFKELVEPLVRFKLPECEFRNLLTWEIL